MADLAAAVQEATDDHVEVAFVDQGSAAQEVGIDLSGQSR